MSAPAARADRKPIEAFKITGLCAATFTPYREDGSVDCAAVDAHCKDLAAHDVRFAFINGTTGDSMCLSDDERKRLAEAWVTAGRAHGVAIVNHIGANSITSVLDMAAHAEAIRCDAISAMPPFFFKAPTTRGVAEWLQRVGAAAPSTPLYYYHFSAMTGVALDPLELVRECEAVGVPTFRGFKFTDYNLFTYEACLTHAGGRYDVAYGRDEAAIGAVALGAAGHIGNAFNYAPGPYKRLRAAVAAGDLAAARAEQHRANALVHLMGKYGPCPLSVNRVMYELKGAVKLGPPRAPLVPLSAEQRAALEADLRGMGFFEWCD